MDTTLNVTIIQTDLVWEDPVANRKMFSKKFDEINSATDLIILPEMFPTGFSINAENLAEPEGGDTLEWMISEAKSRNVALTGSVIVRVDERYFNRLYFVHPNGDYEIYDKRHTFTFAGENETYSAGKEQVLIDYKGWRIRPLICYDLRFPVWARNHDNYDMLFYIASWPKVRMLSWDTLLRARAIENMAYCVGVNRVGKDGNGHDYVGHSAIYDSVGQQISRKDFEGEFIETIALSKEELIANRKRFHFLDDRDNFRISY